MSLQNNAGGKISRARKILREQGVKKFVEETAFFLLRRTPFLRSYAKVIERDYKDYIELPWGDYGYRDFLKLEAKFIYGLLRSENYSLKKSVKLFRQTRSQRDNISSVYSYEGFGRYHSLKPMQISSEIRDLTELMEKENIQSLLEIGSARNGNLAIWADFAQELYSVDLPESDPRRSTLDKKDFLKKIFEGTEFVFIRGNSHDNDVQKKMEKTNQDFDFAFIDGDHTCEGVKEDFYFYKNLVKSGGMIAFHDIKNDSFGVSEFWEEIKNDYETEEFVDETVEYSQGIGVLYL